MTEPWRINLLHQYIAVASPYDQEMMIRDIMDAPPEEQENRLKAIAPEKPFLTRAGEWLKEHVPDWAAGKQRLGQGWQFTTRNAKRADAYVGREIVPHSKNARRRFEKAVDDFLRRHPNGF